ncbi:DoxX family protein [Spirillospora sp. NPDC052242]
MTAIDVAALLVRAVVGVTMVLHGCNHLWGGGGVAGTAGWFASLGMRPAKVHALLSGVGEIAAGTALVVGLVAPLACAFVVGTMVVAGVTAHRKNGFFIFRDGYEYVLVIAVACVALALLGAGTVSVDRMLGIEDDLRGGLGAAIAIVGGVGGAVLLLGASWRPSRAAG